MRSILTHGTLPVVLLAASAVAFGIVLDPSRFDAGKARARTPGSHPEHHG